MHKICIRYGCVQMSYVYAHEHGYLRREESGGEEEGRREGKSYIVFDWGMMDDGCAVRGFILGWGVLG